MNRLKSNTLHFVLVLSLSLAWAYNGAPAQAGEAPIDLGIGPDTVSYFDQFSPDGRY